LGGAGLLPARSGRGSLKCIEASIMSSGGDRRNAIDLADSSYDAAFCTIVRIDVDRTASDITVREVLSGFETEFAAVAHAIENGEFAPWVGSGISC
jgi:hypothetical protein